MGGQGLQAHPAGGIQAGGGSHGGGRGAAQGSCCWRPGTFMIVRISRKEGGAVTSLFLERGILRPEGKALLVDTYLCFVQSHHLPADLAKPQSPHLQKGRSYQDWLGAFRTGPGVQKTLRHDHYYILSCIRGHSLLSL